MPLAGTTKRSGVSIRCFDKAILIQPEYAAAWKNKGVALQALGRHTEGKEVVGLARKLSLQ